jgi:hypothetical protein
MTSAGIRCRITIAIHARVTIGTKIAGATIVPAMTSRVVMGGMVRDVAMTEIRETGAA